MPLALPLLPAPYASALSLARGMWLVADITGSSVSARGLKREFEKPILHHWLKIQLRSTQSNPDAIGIRIAVMTVERSHYHTIFGGTGFGSMNDSLALIGLGHATQIQRLDIRWPSGIKQQFENLSANQHLIITEGDATLAKRNP